MSAVNRAMDRAGSERTDSIARASRAAGGPPCCNDWSQGLAVAGVDSNVPSSSVGR